MRSRRVHVSRLARATNDDASRTLTTLFRVFDVNAADFFRALRKFMMASSAALSARADRGAGGRRRSGGGGDARAASVDAPTNAGESLNELEAALSISELRTSFAFTQVVAQKYRHFFDVHFDASRPGGAALARFGWRIFLAAKRAALPRFPDLYSCYHLLVVVQAFMLVNAPASLLRTDLRNMVSMSARDEDGNVDALASLSAYAKTKLPALRDALATFQKETVQGVFAAHLAAARGEMKNSDEAREAPRGVRWSPRRRVRGVSPTVPRVSPGYSPRAKTSRRRWRRRRRRRATRTTPRRPIFPRTCAWTSGCTSRWTATRRRRRFAFWGTSANPRAPVGSGASPPPPVPGWDTSAPPRRGAAPGRCAGSSARRPPG